jgi:TorA maturation chaperone TorD
VHHLRRPVRLVGHDRPDTGETGRPLDVCGGKTDPPPADVRDLPDAGCPRVAGCVVKESVMKRPDLPGWFSTYASIRTDAYVLLASLLGRPPSEELLKILRNLEWDEGIPERMDQALRKLTEAGRTDPLAAVEREFNRLFIGLSGGQIEPSASWYKEGILQSTPLASLRSDLFRLGIVRQVKCSESEDHAGPLCEIMALISQKSPPIPYGMQETFFQRHIASWMTTFFEDLQSAGAGAFYDAVGRFGSCFLESEEAYLKYRANA